MPVSPKLGLSILTPGVTPGTGWALDLEADKLLIDDHDHTETGNAVPTAGISIDDTLPFNGFSAGSLLYAMFGNQTVHPTASGDIRAVYVYGNDLWYRNAAGTTVQLTSGGALAPSASANNTFATHSTSTDETISASSSDALWSVDASSSNRSYTLPSASAVTVGRFYVFSDRLGSCSAARTVTIGRAGSDTIDGATSVAISNPYGMVVVVCTTSTTWRVFHVQATTSRAGTVTLAQDLAGVATAPSVVAMTGAGGTGALRMATLSFDGLVAGPTINQGTRATGSGQTLTLRAQSGGVSGTTSGGSLALRPGAANAGGTDGSVQLQAADGTVIASVQPTYLRVDVAGGLLFEKGTVPLIGCEARTTSGSGTTLSIRSQGGLTAGNGGAINIVSGSSGATSGSGGAISVTGGTGKTSNGGGITIQAGASVLGSGGGSENGGAVSLITGTGYTGSLSGFLTGTVGETGGANVWQGAEVAAGRFVLGLCLGATNVSSTNVPSGNGVVFLKAAATDPSSAPSGGSVIYHSSSGYILFRTPVGNVYGLRGDTGAGIPGGAGWSTAAIAAPADWTHINIGGTEYRIPIWS